jgi:hypothetical protein
MGDLSRNALVVLTVFNFLARRKETLHYMCRVRALTGNRVQVRFPELRAL